MEGGPEVDVKVRPNPGKGTYRMQDSVFKKQMMFQISEEDESRPLIKGHRRVRVQFEKNRAFNQIKIAKGGSDQIGAKGTRK